MPVSPTPPRAMSVNYSNPAPKKDALSADPDIILVGEETYPVALQEQLVMTNIGGVELIDSTRYDFVNGQKVPYKIIKDLDYVASEFTPKTITGFSSTLSKLKTAFGINLDTMKTPEPDATGSLFSGTSNNEAKISVALNGVGATDIVEVATSIASTSGVLGQQQTFIDGGTSAGYYDGIIDGGNSLGYNIDITTDGGGA